MSPTLEQVRALDAADPLRAFRDRFFLPEGIIYLDGNSLGALPRAAVARQRAMVEEEWGSELIRSWNTRGWIEAPQRIGAKIAPLIGAKPNEVIVADFDLGEPVQADRRRGRARPRPAASFCPRPAISTPTSTSPPAPPSSPGCGSTSSSATRSIRRSAPRPTSSCSPTSISRPASASTWPR